MVSKATRLERPTASLNAAAEDSRVGSSGSILSGANRFTISLMNPNREPLPGSSVENNPRSAAREGPRPVAGSTAEEPQPAGDQEQGEGSRLNNAEPNSSNTGRSAMSRPTSRRRR